MLNFAKNIICILFFSISTQGFAATMHTDKFINYTDVGQGEPIIFIHAFPTDQDLWNPQQQGLKNYFRVITLDLWGFGGSAGTDGNAVLMSDYASEIKAVMEQLQIQHAIIAGESMGGYVALEFLQQYPEKVDGLILSDTQALADSEEAKAKREKSAQEVLANGTQALIAGFMPKALTPNAPAELKNFLLNILDRQNNNGVASALRGMARRDDMQELLKNSDKPILILSGKLDTLINPEQSIEMHKLAKNSELVMIDNAAHLANLENPQAWNQAVIDMFYKARNK